MKVAIPVWEGRVSPVFDAARRLMVVKLEGGMEMDRREIPLAEQSPSHRARRMADLEVDVLICGAISRSCVDLMDALKITVIPWVTGKPDEILSTFIAGELPNPQYAMPGHR